MAVPQYVGRDESDHDVQVIALHADVLGGLDEGHEDRILVVVGRGIHDDGVSLEIDLSGWEAQCIELCGELVDVIGDDVRVQSNLHVVRHDSIVHAATYSGNPRESLHRGELGHGETVDDLPARAKLSLDMGDEASGRTSECLDWDEHEERATLFNARRGYWGLL